MNYEEKYKEILEWARKNKARLNGVPIEEVLPELAESEDERIRRELKEAFEAYDIESTWNGIPIRSIFAWLEKQKEQIPYTDFVIKPHKGDDNNPYDMRVSEAQEYAIKRGFGVPFNDGEVYVDERHMTQTIGNILRWADEHPKEQKPTDLSEMMVHKEPYIAPVPTPMVADEQKPAEWSEEDENMRESAIALIRKWANYSGENVGDAIKVISWLQWLPLLAHQH